jgi:hypothetical protein
LWWLFLWQANEVSSCCRFPSLILVSILLTHWGLGAWGLSLTIWRDKGPSSKAWRDEPGSLLSTNTELQMRNEGWMMDCCRAAVMVSLSCQLGKGLLIYLSLVLRWHQSSRIPLKKYDMVSWHKGNIFSK